MTNLLHTLEGPLIDVLVPVQGAEDNRVLSAHESEERLSNIFLNQRV